MADPLSPLKRFFRELRRRHVIRVSAVYLVVAWILIQVADIVFPALQLPGWTTTLVVVLTLFGFPLAVMLAWAFEMTPEGIRRTPPPRTSLTPPEEEGLGGLLRRLGGDGGRGPVMNPGRDGSAGGAAAGGDVSTAPPPSGWTTSPGRGSASATVPAGSAAGGRSLGSGAPVSEAPEPERVRRASIAKLRHDLRSPINAVVGYAELLLEEDVDEEDGETGGDLRKIRRAGKELQAVVDQVLDPETLGHRREAGEASNEAWAQDLQHRLRTPLNAVIGYGELIQERRRDAGRREPDPDVEKILSAGRQLLERVDEIVGFCRAQIRGEATDSDYARVSTIAREALSRIRAVTPGQGAAAGVTGASLLVIDDSELNRDLLTKRLALQGFTVSTARDGREGLDRLRSQPFDLVLLDILMPEMDGVEVLTRMKEDRGLRDVPVIMISALDEVDAAVRCIEAGAADYVSKPFDPVLLTARVAAALRTRELHEESRRCRDRLDFQQELVERVLYARFPRAVAERIRRGETGFAERYAEASVLCLRFVGLHGRLSGGEPIDGLRRLDAVRTWVREAASEQGVDTVLFEGEECLAIAGVPLHRDDHAETAVGLALALLEGAGAVSDEARLPLRLRMGLHTGSVSAGVAKSEALSYEAWGEAVRMARGLESAGVPDAVHVSAGLHGRLGDRHAFESRGVVSLGDQGQIRTWLLHGKVERPA